MLSSRVMSTRTFTLAGGGGGTGRLVRGDTWLSPGAGIG
jgi:hypothetical protein